MREKEKKCGCGEPLHYRSKHIQEVVQRFVDELGEYVEVRVGGRGWLISRHFMACHGLKAAKIEEVAAKYGFREVP